VCVQILLIPNKLLLYNRRESGTVIGAIREAWGMGGISTIAPTVLILAPSKMFGIYVSKPHQMSDCRSIVNKTILFDN